jgi:hypothetical protein
LRVGAALRVFAQTFKRLLELLLFRTQLFDVFFQPLPFRHSKANNHFAATHHNSPAFGTVMALKIFAGRALRRAPKGEGARGTSCIP